MVGGKTEQPAGFLEYTEDRKEVGGMAGQERDFEWSPKPHKRVGEIVIKATGKGEGVHLKRKKKKINPILYKHTRGKERG